MAQLRNYATAQLRHDLSEIFQNQGVEAAWTHNELGLLIQQIWHTADGQQPHNSKQNLEELALLLNPMLTAQLNTGNTWHGAAELCHNMQVEQLGQFLKILLRTASRQLQT